MTLALTLSPSAYEIYNGLIRYDLFLLGQRQQITTLLAH